MALPGADLAARDGAWPALAGPCAARDAELDPDGSLEASGPPSADAIAAGPAKNTPTAKAAAPPRANLVAFFVDFDAIPELLLVLAAPQRLQSQPT
jgi:hypothetical protein